MHLAWFYIERVDDAIRGCRACGSSDERERRRSKRHAQVRARISAPTAVDERSMEIPDEATNISRRILLAAFALSVTHARDVRL